MEIGESVSTPAVTKDPAEPKPPEAHPCDIDKLTLEVTADDDGKSKTIKVETDTQARFKPVTDVKGRDALAWLRSYDVVIECLADPKAGSKAKAAKIGATGAYVGLKCADKKHAYVVRTDRHLSAITEKRDPNAATAKIDAASFYASTNFFDQLNVNRKGTYDTVFGLIRGIVMTVFSDPYSVEVRADSCGSRLKTDKKRPNYKLYGLVRVIPKSKWAIGVKIPPLGSFKHERTGEMDFAGTKSKSKTTETTAGMNFYSNSTTQKSSGEGVLGTYKNTQEKQVGGKVDSYEQSRSVKNGSVTETFKEEHSKTDGQKMTKKDGKYTQEDIKERLKRASGFDIVITHNDTELELFDQIEKIKKKIEEIAKVIGSIKDIFEKLPQVGWKFSFDVSLFAGTISLELSQKYADALKANGRYQAVEYKLKGSLDIKIIDLSVSLSFGIDIRALDSGIVAKIEGKLTVEAGIQKEIDMSTLTPEKEWGVTAKLGGKLSVYGSVSLFGKTLADAELSLTTALELVEGKLLIALGSATKFDLKGKLRLKPIELNGYIRVPYWFDSKIDPPVKITDGIDPIHEFT